MECGLELHEVVHTNERPYKCRFCEADYKHKTSRLNYERGVHTLERPSVCWVCQFSFTRLDRYTRHFNLHRLRYFNLYCPVEGCREMFVTPEALEAHLTAHAKEVEYVTCALVGEAALWKHRGQTHQEFPSPEHSSMRESQRRRPWNSSLMIRTFNSTLMIEYDQATWPISQGHRFAWFP
jgi:hypothetical protein